MSSSTHTPLVFRIPAWFKVDPTRNQKSVKQGLVFYNFLRAGWWMCASDCKMHQTARPDFIFSLLSQPNFTSLILSFSLQLGQVAVPLTAKRKRKSLYRGSDISLLPPNPPYHMFIHTHTYTVKAQLQAENGPNHVAVKNALFIPASSSWHKSALPFIRTCICLIFPRK